MQSSPSKVIIASAGSGKTTFLVEEALSNPDKRIAVVTYTNNNLEVIKRTFCEKHGVTPARVDVRTWFGFLLHECSRPYQRSVYSRMRVKAIHFSKGRSARFARYADTKRYYFRNDDEVYSDKISRFVIDCEEHSGGRMTRRLREMYDAIYVDELQDLAGYDLEVLEAFMRAGISMVLVGDPRQTTYTTNQSAKNSQYRDIGFLKKVREWQTGGLCTVETHARSFRCNQKICDFADRLWPEMEKTVSCNSTATEHDGIFVVSTPRLQTYVDLFSPVLLRYDRRSETYGYPALNFGEAKGMTFDRVLVLPHGPIRKYLSTGALKDIAGSLRKFYVAVTRARYSVAFLYDGEYWGECVKWQPTQDD